MDSENFKKNLEDQRDHLRGILKENQINRDKLLLTISGGAFVVSITFLVGIAKDISNVFLLKISWILLGISLVLQIVEYVYAINKGEKIISDINKYINIWTNEDLKKYCDKNNSVSLLNYFTIFFVFFGILFLILFSSINIGKFKSNIEKNRPNQDEIKYEITIKKL